MKKTLLLQFRTDKSLDHEKHCIAEKGMLDQKDIEVINVLDENIKLPSIDKLNNYSGVILGGSGEIDISCWDTATSKRIKQIKPFVLELIENDFPSLFICFGHQLVAYFLGSEVRSDASQSEVGTFEIKLTDEGRRSELFAGIPDTFFVVEGHKDSVMQVPKTAKLLAHSDRCKIQALMYGKNIYSTQFHAELDKDSLFQRLSLYPTYMKGRSKKEIMKNFSDIPYANKIINNWIRMIRG